MDRVLITEILNKIAADLPQFKTVDLFNNQFDKQDEGGVDSFAFPALFVSFPDGVDYLDFTAGVQRTKELTVRFYIADKLTKSRLSISKTVLEIMDLKQAVFFAFNGFSSAYIKRFSRIHEEPDENRKNYYIFIQDYKTDFTDVSKYVDNLGPTVTLTPVIDSELIINPLTDNGIRTAKDVNDNI
jgi:hypothetical protein